MLLFIFMGIIGCSVGSFLNVVAYRLQRGEDFIMSRSYCPQCQNRLKWYDLLPVLSFILLRGRCRYCYGRIRIRYLLTEILGGIGFLLIYSYFRTYGIVTVIDQCVLWSMGELCALIDWEERVVYPIVLYFFVGIHLVMRLLSLNITMIYAMLTGLFLYGVIALVGCLIWQEEAFGRGDIYYLVAVASWFSVRETLVIGLLAFVIAGGIVLLQLLIHKNINKEIPFVPAIFLSELLILFTGIQWLGW